MRPLTPWQARVLKQYFDIANARGRCPSYQELAESLGLASGPSLGRLLRKLANRGYVGHQKYEFRSYSLLIPQAEWEISEVEKPSRTLDSSAGRKSAVKALKSRRRKASETRKALSELKKAIGQHDTPEVYRWASRIIELML